MVITSSILILRLLFPRNDKVAGRACILCNDKFIAYPLFIYCFYRMTIKSLMVFKTNIFHRYPRKSEEDLELDPVRKVLKVN